MTRAFLLVGLVVASTTLAGPRISVLPFKGPKATAPRAQIYFPLCEDAECVAPDKASHKGKPDLAKARKNRLDGLLTGTVLKVKKKPTLELKLISVRGESLLKKSYPLLPNGKLAPKTVSQVKAAVLSAANGGGGGEDEEPSAAVAERSAPEEKEAAPEPAERAERAKPSEPVAEAPSEPSSSESADEFDSSSRRRNRDSDSEESSTEVSKRVEPSGSKDFKDPVISAQVGSDMFAPSLRFAGVATTNLRNYSSPLVVAPRFRAELYPLALFTKSAANGFGLEVDYAFSVASRTRRPGDDVVYGTSSRKLDFGARFRISPIKRSKFAITPYAGYRMMDFTVGAGTDGSKLEGLPNIGYRTLRLGAELNVPLMEAISVSAGASYLHVLSTGEIGTEYFPGASAQGFEAGGGVSYAFAGGFEARALVNFTRHALKFKPAEGAAYFATGATDQQFGGSVALRYTY